MSRQECIPVGCVAPTAVAVMGPGTPLDQAQPPGADPSLDPPCGQNHRRL